MIIKSNGLCLFFFSMDAVATLSNPYEIVSQCEATQRWYFFFIFFFSNSQDKDEILEGWWGLDGVPDGEGWKLSLLSVSHHHVRGLSTERQIQESPRGLKMGRAGLKLSRYIKYLQVTPFLLNWLFGSALCLWKFRKFSPVHRAMWECLFGLSWGWALLSFRRSSMMTGDDLDGRPVVI